MTAELDFEETDIVPTPLAKFLNFKELQPDEEIIGILVDRYQKYSNIQGKEDILETVYRFYRTWGSKYENEFISLNGSYELDNMLSQVKDGTLLRIIYQGKVVTGKTSDGKDKTSHKFRVTPGKETPFVTALRQEALKVAGPTPTLKEKKAPQSPKSTDLNDGGMEIPF